ncbi:MAG: gliding motility-associated ABC transporter substrate-binding protein GldG, partial [Flammeovirgaceae bacterium]|nr:gliding motility-associated ABC transporter substrate-binding protein GldG [Flammeovirgaceae bacterium]
FQSGGKVSFQFTNPHEASNPAARNRFYQQLTAKGLPYTTLYEMIDGEQKQKIIFPGAIVSTQGKETAVLLLKGNKASSPQEQLNQSIEGVEYELAVAIQKLTSSQKKHIAFTEGHDELSPKQLVDLLSALKEFYQVSFINLAQENLSKYSAIIVARPEKPFSELEKFELDQYVMKGGNALFLIDKVQMNLDSIPLGGAYAIPYDLNLEDLLFRYGVRLNAELIQDQQAGLIEVYVGEFGNRPNIKRLPWVYHMYLNTYSKHPAVKNLDAIYSKFVGTIDTVKAVGIRKTPLVFSSKYSRIKPIPNMVSLDEIKEAKQASLFNRPHLPVAYLLEGEFTSLFANRFPPKNVHNTTVIRKGKPAKVFVMSDGDIIRNEFNKKTGNPEAIDYDKYRQQTLSNKEFFLNILSYMTDENGLISSRKKEIIMRPLDTFRLKTEKLFWQVFNIVLPVFLIVLFGIVRFFWRKRAYEQKSK